MEFTERHTEQRDLKRKNAELSRLVNELRGKVNQLYQLREEKNYLITAVAHDLRAPLHQMMGLAQILLRDQRHLPELHEACASKIHESASQLSALVAKILDPHAIEHNVPNVNLCGTWSGNILNDVVEMFRPEADAKNITLIADVDDPAPALIDHQYFKLVVENLLSNAVKFTPPAGKIEARVYARHGKVFTEIQDSGPGFSPDELPRLFRKFQKFRARPTGDEPSYGLGLSIVKRYVDLMHGEISCESEPGKGTMFRLVFGQAT